MANDARFLALPPELRVLAEFFEEDARPSALLDVEQRKGGKPGVIYQNAAFRDLVLEQHGLEELAQRLARAREDGHGSLEAGMDGRNWNSRTLSRRWTSLVCTTDQKHLHDLVLPQYLGGVKACSPMPIEAENFKDWTRFDMPGLSPWIQFIRNYDWGSTGVGPMSTWSSRLRQCVVFVMSNPAPRLLMWGKDYTFIYNEPCVSLFKQKHPHGMGVPASVFWAEVWEGVGYMVRKAAGGETVQAHKLPLTITRSGLPEDTYWTFTLLPILGSDGQVAGTMSELVDITQAVRGERRRHSLLQISERITAASTLKGLWSGLLAGLEFAVDDAPFAMFYSVAADDQAHAGAHKRCLLEGTAGVTSDNQLGAFCLTNGTDGQHGITTPCLEAFETQKTVQLEGDDAPLADFVASVGHPDVLSVLFIPLVSIAQQDTLGVLVLGLSPRCPYDEEYQAWVQFMRELLERSASLILLPEAQRQAQKISDDINSSLAQQLRLSTLQAEKSDARFSRMAESAPMGMFQFTADGQPVSVNDAYLEMLGMTGAKEELVFPASTSWIDRVHPDDLERFFAPWQVMIEQKVPVTIEYRLKRPWVSVDSATGHEIKGETWLSANAFPEIGVDGKVATVQGWLTDISHQKFSERLIAQRLEDALENKRQSENFIDMTSHEMRNPLSAILQSADSIVSVVTPHLPVLQESMMVSYEIAEEILDAAQTIVLCAQHQKRIVDDILTLSKLDAKLLVISPDKVQPPHLIERVLKMYDSEIVRAGISVRLCVEPSYKELNVDWLLLDSSRLMQVVINLLTNAVKFTQDSQTKQINICLGASLRRPTGQHHGVSFVPVRHAREIPPSRAEWGDGEDVFLQIAVSDTGRGLSKDEMKVLFQRFSQASPKTYKQYGGSGLGLFISRELCELQGGQIGVASGAGKTTFTFYVQTKRWLLEFSDDADGTAGAPLTRYGSATAGPVAFVRRGSVALQEAPALTSTAVQRRQGAADSDQPDSVMQPAKANGVKLSPVTSPATQSTDGKLHVLIVEDNLVNQKVMAKQLRKADCNVHVANHGVECLSFLEQSTFCAAATPLSVILLDLEMPVMDGLTCIRHIRAMQQRGTITSHVPVIAVTANARSEQISDAIEAGMDQVVTKPFRIPELVPQMKTLITEIQKRSAS